MILNHTALALPVRIREKLVLNFESYPASQLASSPLTLSVDGLLGRGDEALPSVSQFDRMVDSAAL